MDITHKLACDKIEQLAYAKGRLECDVESLKMQLRNIKSTLLKDRAGLIFLYGEDFVRELEEEIKGPQS